MAEADQYRDEASLGKAGRADDILQQHVTRDPPWGTIDATSRLLKAGS